MSRPCLEPPLPRVIGHRGAAARAPENTLAALRAAKRLGCSWVEVDVRLTGDGTPVLCHDPRLDRTTSGVGAVAGQTLAAIRRCDAGAWFAPAFAGEVVPTLDEALTLAGGLGLGINLEIKAEPGREYATAAAVVSVLRGHRGGAPTVLLSSFLRPALAALRALAPRLPLGLLFRAVPRGWAEIARVLGCAVIGADQRRLRQRTVARVRNAGYPLAAYTVNDPARARVLFDWGVTSVFSDAPDVILRAAAGADVSPARQGAIS